MARAKRTDVHRPSAIVPEAYAFVALVYHGADANLCNAALGERGRFIAHRERTGGRFAEHEGTGGCYVCGASYAFGATFWHEERNEYISVGWQCADKLDFSLDGEAFRHWKKTLGRERKLIAGKVKARATLEERGLGHAWELSLLPEVLDNYSFSPETGKENRSPSWAEHQRRRAWFILRDVVGKLVKYGSLSEAQYGLLRRLLDQIAIPLPEPAPELELQHVGTPGKREEFDVTLRAITSYESDLYGTVTIYILEDPARNLLIWKTSSGSLGREKGTSFRIKATVKDHGEYKGQKQTRLSRVKVLS